MSDRNYLDGCIDLRAAKTDMRTHDFTRRESGPSLQELRRALTARGGGWRALLEDAYGGSGRRRPARARVLPARRRGARRSCLSGPGRPRRHRPPPAGAPLSSNARTTRPSAAACCPRCPRRRRGRTLPVAPGQPRPAAADHP
eukprot:1185901-Prorocentrum_minimum.AAC.3